MKKTCEDVAVPALRITHFEAGTPPERGFAMTEPAAAKTEAACAGRNPNSRV